MQALRSLGSIVSLDWDGNLRIDVVATCECVALSSLWYVKWISDLKRRTFVSIKSFHSTKGHIGCKICDITSEKRALLIIFYLYVVHFAICILFHSSFKHLKPPNKCVYHQTSDKILKHSKEQSSLLLTPLATSLCLLLLMSNVALEGNSTRAERSARLNLDPGRGDWGDGGDGRSFVRGQSLYMIICKRPDPLGDHLQVACPSNWSFARGWILQMII